MTQREWQGDDAAIGVGMGGSCPSCRAPVDLGQEFCLECGAPIRFTARQRRQARQAGAGGAAAAARPRGFPWVPFLVVLGLVVAGVAFALVEGGEPSKRSSDSADVSTEPALPTIGSTPDTTTPAETTTLQDCDPSRPVDAAAAPVPDAGGTGTVDDTQPAADGVDDIGGLEQSGVAPGSTTTPGEQIPTITPDAGLDDTEGTETVPSTTPGDASTVTVDQFGNPCDAGTTTTDTTATTPTTTTGTGTTTTGPTGTTADTSGGWPEGRDGWTVIVFGYPGDEQRARASAADLQEDGFDAGVLDSSQYSSLCPGFWVVFSGVFADRSSAERRERELARAGYAGVFVREIRRTGGDPGTCRPASSQ